MNIPEGKKRILYIITQPTPWGGAQRYVYDVATSLHHAGWQVTVAMGTISNGGSGLAPAPIAAGEALRAEASPAPTRLNLNLKDRLAQSSIKTVIIPHLTRSVQPVKNIRAIFEIRALCKDLKPDIVHLNSSMAGVVGAIGARLAGVKKIVYTVHGLVTKEPLPFPLKLTYWLAEWIAGRFRDLTICVSEDDRRAVIRQHIASPPRTVTIPIGIDPDIPFLSREEARKVLIGRHPPLRSPLSRGETSTKIPLPKKGEDGGEGVWIGTIAGLYKTKGLDTLIEAAHLLFSSPSAKGGRFSPRGLSERVPVSKGCDEGGLSGTVPQAREFRSKKNEQHSPIFLIIGDGPERPHLETLIQKHNLTRTIFLLGALPDAARYLKAFDCFVLPSVKEGMPYTILEALAAGIPIVASDVGGIHEIFTAINTGITFGRSSMNDPSSSPLQLVPPRNPHILAEAIENVIMKERGMLPLSASVFPERFSLSRMIQATLTAYHQSHS